MESFLLKINQKKKKYGKVFGNSVAYLMENWK
jgi:hypothetical protein